MIVETVTPARFIAEMRRHGFSYKGALAIFEYLEEMSEATGQPIEFDQIALRCEFTEYPSLEAAAADYGSDEFRIDVIAAGDGFIVVHHT